MKTKFSPVIQHELDRIVATIVAKFNPEKVILFGSYAWGEPHRDSDLDFFIVKETDDTRALGRRIDGTFYPNRPFAMDFIVYRPEGVTRRLEIEDSFIRKVMTEGKVLYDRRGRATTV